MDNNEFISKHLGKTYKELDGEEVMIVGISEEDIIIGRYDYDGWNHLFSYDEIKFHSPMIKTYSYLWHNELDIVDKLLSK